MAASGLAGFAGGFIVMYLLCQVSALRRWEGWWWTSALLPASVISLIAAKIIYEIGVDIDSHALWPLEALLWSAGGLGFLSALYLAKGVAELTGADALADPADPGDSSQE